MAGFRITTSISKGKRQMIGTICLNWSILEFYVQKAVRLAGGRPPKEHEKDLEAFDMNKWRKALKLAAKKQPEPLRIKFRDIAGAIKEMQPERNLIIHAYWGLDDDGALHAITFRPGKYRGANAITFKKMEKLNRDIMQQVVSLHPIVGSLEGNAPS